MSGGQDFTVFTIRIGKENFGGFDMAFAVRWVARFGDGSWAGAAERRIDLIRALVPCYPEAEFFDSVSGKLIWSPNR